MRAMFSLVSLLVVVAVIGLLAKKQLTSIGNPTPASEATGTSPPGTTPAQRSQQMQQQMKQAIEQAQQPRPIRDDQ